MGTVAIFEAIPRRMPRESNDHTDHFVIYRYRRPL